MSQGKLIVLEGTDGSGKSTQIKLIKKYLENKDLKCEYLHFPMYGHNEAAEVIAKFLRGEFGGIDEVNPFFVANIYAMDRFLYLPELYQKLNENDVVILDRYVFSNMAFQAAKLDKDDYKSWTSIIDWIDKFEFEFLNLPYPDLTIFFDVPIKVVSERLKSQRQGDDRNYLQGKQDIHEADIEFQKRVRDTYISLYEEEDYEDYHVISCAIQQNMPYVWDVLTPEELFNTYINLIENIL